MNSTTSLLIVLGASLCFLAIALVIIMPYDIEDQLNIKHPNPKIGPCASQRCMIVAVVWLAPTAAMLAGWMVWG